MNTVTLSPKELAELDRKLKLTEKELEARSTVTGLKSIQIYLLQEHMAFKKFYDVDMTFFDDLTHDQLKSIITDDHQDEFSDVLGELKICIGELTKERAECYHMLCAMYSDLLSK